MQMSIYQQAFFFGNHNAMWEILSCLSSEYLFIQLRLEICYFQTWLFSFFCMRNDFEMKYNILYFCKKISNQFYFFTSFQKKFSKDLFKICFDAKYLDFKNSSVEFLCRRI